MTTIEALQNLYEALGGEASAVENINTIPAMLSEIAGVLPEGDGLPEVTAEDNGDILGVVDGAWAKMDAPSGGAKVDIFETSTSGTSVTLLNGKTVGDILDSIAVGNVVYLAENEGKDLLNFTSSNGPYLKFTRIYTNNPVNPTDLIFVNIILDKMNREATSGGRSTFKIAEAT